MKVNGDFPGLSVGWASWVDAEAEVSSGLPITFFTKMLEGAPDLAYRWHILTCDSCGIFGKTVRQNTDQAMMTFIVINVGTMI